MPSVIRHAAWSSTGLMASVSRNMLLPENQQTFSATDLLAFLNEACRSTVVPFILAQAQNYFLKMALVPVIQSNSKALALGSGPTQGSNVAYQLPADAVGKRLHNVSVVNAGGGIVSLPQVTELQVGSYMPAQGCYVKGDVLYLYPATQFNGQSYIQITYPAAPLALCDDTGLPESGQASSAMVTAVDYDTGEITLERMPTSFEVGAAVNVVRGDPQFATTVDTEITAIASNVLTVPTEGLLDAEQRPLVEAGSWVANAGYSPFLQLPEEALNLTTQAAIVKITQAQGDDEGWKRASVLLQEMQRSAMTAFAPRIDDSPKVISALGRGVGGYWRRGMWVWR